MAQISLKKAALINAVSKYTSILFGIIFSMILARILTPEDYGIVAVTTVFTNFFTIFADMGISTGIIQFKNLTEKDTDSIFTLTAVMGIILGLLFSVFSFFIADFYQNQVYIPIGFMLGVNLFCSTLNIVPEALLLKDKRFVMLAKRNVIIPFITSVLTIFLALAGWKYYALVMQSILTAFFTFSINLYTTRKDYNLHFYAGLTFSGMRKIIGYSAYQFGFSFINYFARNLDNLLIGRVWGAAALGYYDKAYKLMCYPNNSLTHVITPVLQPILSEYQNNKRYIYEKYVKLLKFLSLAGVFLSVFCYFSATDIITIMFGTQWLQAVPYFEMLALAVWAQLQLTSTGSIFQSAGSTRLLFIAGCINTFITATAIIVGIYQGELIDVSRNVMFAFDIEFFCSMYLLIHTCLEQSYCAFLKNFLPEILMIIILFILGKGLSFILPTAVVPALLLRLIVFAIIFLLLCKLLHQMDFLRILRRKA